MVKQDNAERAQTVAFSLVELAYCFIKVAFADRFALRQLTRKILKESSHDLKVSLSTFNLILGQRRDTDFSGERNSELQDLEDPPHVRTHFYKPLPLNVKLVICRFPGMPCVGMLAPQRQAIMILIETCAPGQGRAFPGEAKQTRAISNL